MIVSALALTVLAACGGGGGGNNPPPPPPPGPAAPTALSYPAHGAYTVGVAIDPLTPTVTGTPTSYSISPAAPNGLTINTTTGVISGTPTADYVAANYTVTASNSGGSTSAVVSITINNPALPIFSYAAATQSWATGTPVSLTPTVTAGGPLLAWSVVPALPAGLALNAATGVISGTPTAAAPTRRYVITAQNARGSSEFVIEAAVNASVLLELGHGTGVGQALVDGNRLLTRDGFGHVVLWNSTTGAQIASVDAACEQNCIAIAGGTFGVRSETAVTLYSSATGAELGRIAIASQFNQGRWGLATDGSYVFVHTPSSLSAWSPAGAQLFSRPGNYLVSRIFATPTELRVGNGPAGAQLVEAVTVPGNVATNSATFGGTFHSWFLDGQRFLTVTGNVVGVYSPTATQAALVTLPSVANIGGQANWIWSTNLNTLNIYPVGNTATPAASFAVPSFGTFIPSLGTIAMWNTGATDISVIDLAPATPTRTDIPKPYPSTSAFASLNAGEFWVGTAGGVVLRKSGASAFQRFNLGVAQDIAANANRIVIATDGGPIRIYDSQTLAFVDEIDFRSSDVELSADGTLLVARASDFDAQPGQDQALRVYSLPSKAIVNQWPYTFGVAPYLLDFDLSDSGTALGQGIAGSLTLGGMRTWSVTTPAGSPVWTTSDTFTDTAPFEAFIRLSPTGTAYATPSGELDERQTVTSIYVNGVLTGAVAGFPAGWIDDSRLLLVKYRQSSNGNQDEFDGMAIVNAQGQPVGTPAMTEIGTLQRLNATSIYSPELNQVLEVQTGNVLWTSAAPYPNWSPGAVAGSNVVFQSRATVRVEPR